MKKIIFRIDFGNKFGGGHLKRCLNIAKYLKKFKPVFLIEIDTAEDKSKILKIFRNYNFDYYLFKGFFPKREIKILKKNFLNKNNIILFDFANSYKFKKKKEVKNYIDQLNLYFDKIFFIDSMGSENILRGLKVKLTAAITPYIGASKNKSNYKHYVGGKYFILNNKKNFRGRNLVRKKIKNLLITSGQTDPAGLSALLIRLINSDKLFFQNYKIKLVLGQGFNKNYVKKLKKFISNFKLKINLIENCENLLPYFIWADVGIATNGLTKYEFAKYKVSSILFSFNSTSHKLQKYFDNVSSALYLGKIQNLRLNKLKSSLNFLNNNYHARLRMIKNGYNLIDYKGIYRFVKIIND